MDYIWALLLSTVFGLFLMADGYSRPCPFGCSCIAKQRKRSNVHKIYIKHFLHKYFDYKRKDVTNLDYQSDSPSRGSVSASAQGREMVCLGLQRMPYYIPEDISKLQVYGGRRALKKLKRRTFSSRAPGLLRFGYSQQRASSLFQTVSVQSDDPNAISSYQLTYLAKDAFRQSGQINVLALTGNRIRIIHAGQFDSLRQLKRLSLKKNRIKLVSMASFRGLDNLKKLDLSYNHLDEMPRTLFNDVPNLTQLHLRGNRLKTLHREIFDKLERLKVLDLSQNRIEDLPDDLFRRAANLEELVLSKNEISRIRAYWFYSLRKLKKLHLADNHISVLPAGIFSPVPALIHVDLSGNMLSSVQRHTFANVRKLQHLYLARNRIDFIFPNTFVDLVDLRSLFLNLNQIRKLERRAFGGLKKLERLSLAGNKIREISNHSWGLMKELKMLNLSHNRIQRVRTHTFKGLVKMRDLHLDHNAIEYLENEAFVVSMMSHISMISWVALQFNKIRELPAKVFYGVPHMKFLNLGHNQISRIDKITFKYPVNLRSLILEDNDIGRILPGLFENMKLITHINLKSNNIKSIVPRTLYGMYSTEEINFSHNNISMIIPGSFVHMPRLSRIDLSYNNISSASMDFFRHNHKLRSMNFTNNILEQLDAGDQARYTLGYLGLADNKLQTLNSSITRLLGEQSLFDIHNNPWLCDCRLSWISSDIRTGIFGFIDQDHVRCQYPPQLSQTRISELKTDDFSCAVKAIDEQEKRQYSFSCPKHDRSHVLRVRRTMDIPELEAWHSTVLDNTGVPICGGVQIEKDWVLTHASCWMNKSVTALQIMRGQIKIVSGNYEGSQRNSGGGGGPARLRMVSELFFHPKLSVRQGEEYASITVVKLRPDEDERRHREKRRYPCVRRPSHEAGQRMYVTGRANFLPDKHQVEVYTMFIKGAGRQGGTLCDHESFFCLRWNGKRFRKDVYDMNGAPAYNRDDLSLLGIRAGDHGGKARPFVDVSYYLPWIESTITTEGY
ncbi:uncharacterized protein LOC141912634 [Tubulanus polymorphus]|uniref:uncharacterized protein LOC141912634 n=1 Tax=Tubulanus polymorphus TaxID=672921 RepID=UPI003DA5C0C2